MEGGVSNGFRDPASALSLSEVRRGCLKWQRSFMILTKFKTQHLDLSMSSLFA